MKNLLIIASSLLAACSGMPFPNFPSLKTQYLVEVRDEPIPSEFYKIIANTSEIPSFNSEIVRCLKFEIISTRPYKIQFKGQVPIKQCHLVGGYKPAEIQLLLNWIDDMMVWADSHKKCLK